MTAKRFKIDLDEEAITDNGEYCLSLYCFQDKGEKDVVNLLNELSEENEQLKQQLQKIQDSFELNVTQNYDEFDKDKLYIKDNNTEIRLDGINLFIEVYIPQIKEYYRFKYIVTGRSLIREFIENYNSNGDVE